MKGYDLDEKGGLLGIFGIKNPEKILKKDDIAEIKHYSSFDHLKVKIAEVSETKIRVQIPEDAAAIFFTKGEHVLLHIKSPEHYIISGSADETVAENPKEIALKVDKIDRMKSLAKGERFCVCLEGGIKPQGAAENIPAVVKAVSLSALKMDCKSDIAADSFVDASTVLEKTMKYACKGRIVRKNKIGDLFEYGIEIVESTESSTKNLHRFISQFKYD